MNIELDRNQCYEYIARVKENNLGRELGVYILTFGCQQNEADSEKMLGLAAEMGYHPVDSAENASLILVNTCAIREHAEMTALSTLGNFKRLKKAKPELIIGVCGCISAQPYTVEKIKKDFHYISFTLSPGLIFKLPEEIYRAQMSLGRSFVIEDSAPPIIEGLPTYRQESHRAWVSIMYGCNNFCSYCIVPYVRGRERSRASSDILDECKSLVGNGVREITLLGQNVNSYHSDVEFPELLERIAQIDGDFIIRYMTSHPKDVSERLIDVMARYSPKVAPYFHLPLQSGSNRILRLMNRTYTRESFMEIARALKRKVPGIALSTDVIIGFPSESEEDFLDTMEVLKEIRFDFVYSFNYSPRAGTKAAKMEEQIPKSVMDSRMSRLLRLQDEISLECNEIYVGRIERVLVHSRSQSKGILSGRTYGGKLVHFEADESLIGSFATVEIIRAQGYYLQGKIKN